MGSAQQPCWHPCEPSGCPSWLRPRTPSTAVQAAHLSHNLQPFFPIIPTAFRYTPRGPQICNLFRQIDAVLGSEHCTAIRSLKTQGISHPAHVFRASILGLAEHLSPLRQLLARKARHVAVHLQHNVGTLYTPREAPQMLCTHSLKRPVKGLTRAWWSAFIETGTLSSRLLT